MSEYLVVLVSGIAEQLGRKDDIENILNNLSQGFLTFDPKGDVGKDYSKVAKEMFSAIGMLAINRNLGNWAKIPTNFGMEYPINLLRLMLIINFYLRQKKRYLKYFMELK